MFNKSLTSLFELPTHIHPDIIIYCENINNRLIYVLDFLIKRVWRKNYVLTDNIHEFNLSDKLKINYSSQKISNAINIFPVGLLHSKGIKKDYVPAFEVNAESFYREDIFSNIFFNIARYEEWQKNFNPDIHQRFEWNNAHYKNISHKPYLDEHIRSFENYIQSAYPSFKSIYFYQEIYTFDLDNILAFKGKSILRTCGAFIKHLIKKEKQLLIERTKTLLNLQKDPLESVYEFIRISLTRHPILFFILTQSNTDKDRAAKLTSPQTKKTLHYLLQFADIGIHPSYYSYHNNALIKKEIDALEKILNQKIIFSRQHFLRWDIQITPKILVQQGIQYDFSMGYASNSGFRAGTAHPFYYYDIENEKQTPLLLIPFCTMDGAYFNYHHQNMNNALTDILFIKESIRKNGGYFIPILHEVTLSTLFNKDAEYWKNILLSVQKS